MENSRDRGGKGASERITMSRAGRDKWKNGRGSKRRGGGQEEGEVVKIVTECLSGTTKSLYTYIMSS